MAFNSKRHPSVATGVTPGLFKANGPRSARKGVKQINGYADIAENIEEIMHVMYWYLSQDKRFARMALLISTPRDMVQDAATYLLSRPPEGGWSLTTIAVHGLCWRILSKYKQYYRTIESRRRESIDLTTIPEATPVYLSVEDRQDVRMLVVRALQTESCRNVSIFWERYALGWPVSKIAAKRKRSPEVMRQIANRMFRRLEEAATLPRLAEYVDLLKRKGADGVQ